MIIDVLKYLFFLIVFAFRSVVPIVVNTPYLTSLQNGILPDLAPNVSIKKYTSQSVLPSDDDDSTGLWKIIDSDLISRIWQHRNTNPELSTVYGVAAIASALQEGDSAALPKAYGFTGVAYRNLDQYIKALEYYVKGWQAAIDINDIEEQAYAYLNLGNLNLYIRRPEQSREYLESMGEILGQLDNSNIQA